jgi:hypothetical protein
MRSLARLRAMTLGCAAMFIGIPASQAFAASSPIYRTPAICQVRATAAVQAPADRHAAQLAQSTGEFCPQIAMVGRRANAFADEYFTAAERRRVRRIIDSVARRYVPAQPPSTSARSAMVAQAAWLNLDLDDVRDFAKKSLKKLKKASGYVGKVFKYLPQAQLLRCGVFGAIGATTGYLQREEVRDILIEAGSACASGVVSVIVEGRLGKRKKP